MPEDELKRLREQRMRKLMAPVGPVPEQRPPRKAIIIAESMEDLKNQPVMKIPAETPCCHEKIDIVIPKDVIKQMAKKMKGAHNQTIMGVLPLQGIAKMANPLQSKIPVLPAALRDKFLQRPRFPIDDLRPKRKG